MATLKDLILVHSYSSQITPTMTLLNSELTLSLTKLSTFFTRPLLILVWFKLLPQYSKVWLMSGQSKHEKVSIGTVQTVVSVGVMVWLAMLTTNKIHDLVFPLTWDIGVRQENLTKSYYNLETS